MNTENQADITKSKMFQASISAIASGTVGLKIIKQHAEMYEVLIGLLEDGTPAHGLAKTAYDMITDSQLLLSYELDKASKQLCDASCGANVSLLGVRQ